MKTTMHNNMRKIASSLLAAGWLAVAAPLAGCIPAAFAADAVPAAQSAALARNLAAQPSLSPGQTAAQLPDGRWLIVGPQADATVLDATTGKATALAAKLVFARQGASATLLPDGTVLILGGQGRNGAFVNEAERYEPDTGRFAAIGAAGLISRAHHTATLLSDGRVLIIGGVDAKGQLVQEAELFDPAKLAVERFNARLQTARMRHVAALLPAGSVLAWGGHDHAQSPLNQGELYDPASQRFTVVNAERAAELARPLIAAGPASILGLDPARDARDVSVTQRLSVRFDKRLAVATLSNQTVTLIGPNGSVPLKVVPAEGGLLLFITPREDLLPASRYTLFIKGAQDVHGQALPFVVSAFDTARLAASGNGSPPLASTTASQAIGAVGTLGTAAAKLSAQAQLAAQHGEAFKQLGHMEQQAMAAAEAIGHSEDWLPNATHLRGNWLARRGRSPMQDLPPLQAAPGVTALAGQVLTLHGRALPNATLKIGDQVAHSDFTGRFLLANVPAGDQVLTIDARSASRQQASYGYYQTKVTVAAGQTTALNYTIWMAKLDEGRAASIASPTVGETVVTNPLIPGLELRIPAGTVIRDPDGKIVTRVSITPIPVDRPPFPLPAGLKVPVYFTVQPGGAILTTLDTKASQGARLIYPNFTQQAPGARADFWNYDPRQRGWFVYGSGTVSADGKQTVPDAGVVIREFTGAMIGTGGTPPGSGPPPGSSPGSNPGGNGPGGKGSGNGSGNGSDPGNNGSDGSNNSNNNGSGAGSGMSGGGSNCQNGGSSPAGTDGDPVDCFTGLFLFERTDLFVRDVIPISLTRTYRPNDTTVRPFGIGTMHAYQMQLYAPNQYQEVDLILPDGGRVHYVRISPGTSWEDAVFEHTGTQTAWTKSRIVWNGAGWDLKLTGGFTYRFADWAPLSEIIDRNGNRVVVDRGSNPNGPVQRLVSSHGRSIAFTYDAQGRIATAIDNLDRKVIYEYDAQGRLWKVTDPAGKTETYTYDTAHRMEIVSDKLGRVIIRNEYDTNGRVKKQTLPSGIYQFAYTVNASGVVTQTDVTDPRGEVRRLKFNAAGFHTEVTRALGKPEERKSVYERDPATNFVLSRTDALGRKTAYTYDDRGNVLTETRMAGTAEAVTVTYTYTADFGQVATVKDPLLRTTSFTYDTRGNLKEVKDANNNTVKYEVNGAGLVTAIIDGRGKRTTFDYDGADLIKVTDPLLRNVQFQPDAAGRALAALDPLGNRSVYDYDALDRLLSVTDPVGGKTVFTFDAVGKRAEVKDAKNNLHKFGFDARGWATSYTDPLTKAESYLYDGKGNLTQVTDRKSQITRYAYDPLERLKTVTYADNGTITYTYDKGDRVLTIVDSQNGTITRDYDNLDRLLSEAGPKGTTTYTYYANGLRKTLTVNGQPAITYEYDLGNRLTKITQAAGPSNNNVAQVISFEYDPANRRSKLKLANGITATYGYDDANQLTSITYRKADNSLVGDLTYQYDNAGRRTKLGGSLYTANKQAPVAGGSYNAANRLIGWNGATLAYDLNGNLIGDGGRTFVWNARNQLKEIRDAAGTTVQASFAYDAIGRRLTKTVNGTATGFVYDGLNVTQELNGATTNNGTPANVRSNVVAGGVDEYFLRSTGTGTAALPESFLTDALGSAVQLTNTAQVKTVGYTYEAYGKTTADNAAHSNPFQYTGRENDGNGLYYYRARYYVPAINRFASEDPIGLAGGINAFAYVGGNPVSYVDPEGLLPKGRGERGLTRSPMGTQNPYKHMKPHPTDPNKVIFKDPVTGKKIEKPKPPGFDQQKGSADTSLLEMLIPWPLTPSELGAPACELPGGPPCGAPPDPNDC
jgi:RHS repeat-associated protein